MDRNKDAITELLGAVRARWRRLIFLKAAVRGALMVAAVVAVAWPLAHWIGRPPLAAAALGLVAGSAALAAVLWALWPAREAPSDVRVARFIEEAAPSLDDRLASAVDVGRRGDAPSELAESMLADAARAASAIDARLVVAQSRLQRASLQAVAAALLVLALGFMARDAVRRSIDALSFVLFPSRIAIEVSPGNARLEVGSPMTIEAHLVGNRAPAAADLLRTASEGGGSWQRTPMAPTDADASGAFRIALPPIGLPFRYRVQVGASLSPIFDVAVARPPRVTRIDVDYTFPPAFGLAPRTDEDSGDVYAPAGTEVRLRISTNPPAAAGQLTLADGKRIALTAGGGTSFPGLSGALTIVEDNSYRVALADSEGLKNPGDTEYFIRMLEDRPPEVHIVKPARDRSVTPLEEVDIQARADDDFGIESLELVYALRGGKGKAVPLAIPERALSVGGTHTLALEDLAVQPGDFVTYYVRARDLPRGKPSSETRSDIFFLEVKPFDQGVAAASGGAGDQGSGNPQVDELVALQKDVIVATWKLDRRAQASGGTSSDDTRSVGRAEASLKAKVEQTSSSFRESQMRDPRQGGAGLPAGARAGESTADENDMDAAAAAMGKAAAALNDLKTAPALPPEMEALDHLLRAQAEVKKRQGTAQQTASGNGSNRSNVDLSTRFDKELQRQDRTNYETPKNDGDREGDTALDRIKDLAKRQDELAERQQQVAQNRNQLTPEELKRQLETLAREQADLRQKAEEIARDMQQGQEGQVGQDRPEGREGQAGKTGQTGKAGQTGQQMRAASEAMRGAANELRQQDPGRAAQQGAEAAGALRDLERQLESRNPAGKGDKADERRTLGDLQLETRQLADAERQMAKDLQKLPPGEARADQLRRLSGDQERLADRAQKVEDNLKQQASAAAVAREFDQKRVPQRMKDSVENSPDRAAVSDQDMARDLDSLADKLAASIGPADDESKKLAGERARAGDLRAKLDQLTSRFEKASGSDKAPEGPGPTKAELDQIQQDYERQLQQASQFLDQLRREDPSVAQGGSGFTFEGQGMTLSAPGTEAFKQDFGRWMALRQQVTDALVRAEDSISKRQLAKDSRSRLASGVDDKAPAGYENQVDSYFKALATQKKK